MGGKHLTQSSFYHARGYCINPKDKDFKYYGGRGIKFKLRSVEDLIQAIGERPGKDYGLGRLNVNGHYEVGNIKWMTRKEQIRNRRLSRYVPGLLNKIAQLKDCGFSVGDIALWCGLKRRFVTQILQGKRWNE